MPESCGIFGREAPDKILPCTLGTGYLSGFRVMNLSLVWNLADGMNALMAIPNLLSLVLLSGVAARETRKYLWNNKLDMYGD